MTHITLVILPALDVLKIALTLDVSDVAMNPSINQPISVSRDTVENMSNQKKKELQYVFFEIELIIISTVKKIRHIIVKPLK